MIDFLLWTNGGIKVKLRGSFPLCSSVAALVVYIWRWQILSRRLSCVILSLHFTYAGLRAPTFTTVTWHHLWLLHTKSGTIFFHFLHVDVEIVFTIISNLHIYIQMVVRFFSQHCILWAGYLHPYFITKRLPLLLGIFKCKQWLLIKQKKKKNKPCKAHTHTQKQPIKFRWLEIWLECYSSCWNPSL